MLAVAKQPGRYLTSQSNSVRQFALRQIKKTAEPERSAPQLPGVYGFGSLTGIVLIGKVEYAGLLNCTPPLPFT